MNRMDIKGNQSHYDEIDLFELVAHLWREKIIIIGILLMAALLSLFYALFVTPTYQATAGVLPPQVRDIVELNKGDSTYLRHIGVSEAYQRFLRTLYSEELRNQFYEEVFYPSLSEKKRSLKRDQLRDELNERVNIRKGEQKDQYEIMITHEDPQRAQEWANLYIIGAGNLAKEHLLNDRIAEVESRKERLVNEIDISRKQAEKERAFEIARLEEALYIADELNLQKPLKPKGKSTQEGATYVDRNLLYMRGVDALRAQLDVLIERESDDPFIPRLPRLKRDLDFYNSVTIDGDLVNLYTFDAPAELPEIPIKPKKRLIVIIGLLLGGILGVAAAFLKITLRYRVK